MIHKGRFRQYMRVTFLGKDDVTKILLEDLNKVFASEQRLTLAVTYRTTQRIEEDVKESKKSLNQTKETVERILEVVKESQSESSEAEEQNYLKQILCSTSAIDDVDETYARNLRSLLEGTGFWLLQEQFYNSWLAREATILWIFGGPGSGKTYLSTWIIKQLNKSGELQESDPTAYFFVKENNENLRDANVILKTLAWQVVCQNPDFKAYATGICRQKRLTATAEDTWENLFLNYYSSDARKGRAVTMIVDGLDEATLTTQRTLVGFMKDLVSSQNPKQPAIQLAIIGRKSLQDDMDIKLLGKIALIEVSRAKNKNDIDSYIRKRLEDVAVLREMRKRKPNSREKANKLGNSIMKKISGGADGVFLWAKLLLDSIVEKDLTQIKAALADPPNSLDEMISSVFERLYKDERLDHDELRKILLFAAYVRRPLLFGELNAAVSLPSRRPRILLWKHIRGQLSSVFDLKFRFHIDPDLQPISNDAADDATQEDRQRDGVHEADTDDEARSHFTENDDDDDLDVFSDENEENDNMGTSARQTSIQPHTEQFEGSQRMFSHLDEGQLWTEISFCHARIRDYLVREGNPKERRQFFLPIIPAVKDAQAQITVNCLEMLRAGSTSVKFRRYLCDYPACHLPFHLKSVERAQISREILTKILEGLYWLFGTEDGPLCLIRSVCEYDEWRSSHGTFWKIWVGKENYLKLLQDWFQQAQLVKNTAEWEEPMVTWMISASNSLETLLRPIMMAASKAWLTKPGFDSRECVDKGEFEAWLLHGWLSWVSFSSVDLVPADV
jgi:hypothetical protein